MYLILKGYLDTLEEMNKHSIPLTRIIHENISIVLMYAFSKAPLEKLRSSFLGEWKFLDKAISGLSKERAEKAAIELAVFIRLLDDEQGISGYLAKTNGDSYGTVYKTGLPNEPLYLRDLTNKVMHAKSFEWDISNLDKPLLVTYSQDLNRWSHAEINLVALLSFCGSIAS